MAICLFTGLAQGLSVIVILTAIQEMMQGELPAHLFLLFLLCMGAYFFSFRHVTHRVTILALGGVMEWRIRLATKLRGVGYHSYQKLPDTRMQAALLDGRDIVVEACRLMAATTACSVMMFAAFVLAATISFVGFLYILAIILFGLSVFRTLIKAAERASPKAKDFDLKFGSSLADLIKGFPQLKLSRKKTVDLFKNIITPRHEATLREREKVEWFNARGVSFYAAQSILTQGIILFSLPTITGLPVSDVIQLQFATMILVTPLMGLVSFFPMFSKAEMSLAELADMEDRLDRVTETFERESAASGWLDGEVRVPAFESLSVKGLIFDHLGPEDLPTFNLHVENFELKQGEIVFIRGGNGSGKTTFMNILAGLYSPTTGRILLNGIPQAEFGMEAYRNMFTMVPANVYLFDRLLGLPDADPDAVRQTMNEMQLSRVEFLDNGCFSTLDLSSGQRKRLALVNAIMEDCQVMLLDEVAADFDPEFRIYYYETLLPKLRDQGKTLLVISHDDRYYHVADRLLRLNEGHFESGEGES